MEKKILIYLGEHTNKKDALQRVLDDLHISAHFLTDEELNYTCGYLMELAQFEAKKKEGSYHFESDLMILKDIEDDEIHAINTLLKAMQVEMKRKAMLTKHNQYWYVCDLMQEIEQEHRFFQQMESIRKILTDSKDLIIEEYTSDSWQIYEQAFYQAYDAISKDTTPQLMNEAYESLVSAQLQLRKI